MAQLAFPSGLTNAPSVCLRICAAQAPIALGWRQFGSVLAHLAVDLALHDESGSEKPSRAAAEPMDSKERLWRGRWPAATAQDYRTVRSLKLAASLADMLKGAVALRVNTPSRDPRPPSAPSAWIGRGHCSSRWRSRRLAELIDDRQVRRLIVQGGQHACVAGCSWTARSGGQLAGFEQLSTAHLPCSCRALADVEQEQAGPVALR